MLLRTAKGKSRKLRGSVQKSAACRETMLIQPLDRFWHFASSPIVNTLGSIASIVSISPLLWKYAVRPLWLRRNDAHTMTLENERAYLRDALQDLNRIDKPYWDDK